MILFAENAGPSLMAVVGAERRSTVGGTIDLVELVRKFMDDDVVTVAKIDAAVFAGIPAALSCDGIACVAG